MEVLDKIISGCNDILWSYILIAVLIIAGIYFTFKTKFVQIRLFKEMFRLLTEGATASVASKTKGSETNSISPFQAFCMSTASRVGTGNLAGVAIAIATGGPGAVFWMWLIALIGGASAFVESTLAQIYKIKDNQGYRGGPAYYMEQGLNKKWMGVTFSILITICFGIAFNSVQANTIAAAFDEAFGIKPYIMGAILTIVTALVIFGGAKRIARVAEVLVPIMAIPYVLIALFVIIKNFNQIPYVFNLIFSNAFGLNQAVGGGIGAAMMMGIKRGLFSNEAGMGSAPNAAATAETTHPVKQGLIQALGVFTDTLLICSCTAFMVLLSGKFADTNLNGIQLTQIALAHHIGHFGKIFIAVCILLFAYSSIVGNYYYGETNIEFMNTNKIWLFIYRISVVGIVMYGSIAEMQFVWNLADLFMALMALINIAAISMLGKRAFEALKDYEKQKKLGQEPQFYSDSIEGISNVECWKKSNTHTA